MKNVNLEGQTTDGVNTGGKVVGTSAVAISANTRKLKWGVKVTASAGNTDNVWVGKRPTLTAGSADATDGIELVAGLVIEVPSDSEAAVYVIADAASQKVTFLSY